MREMGLALYTFAFEDDAIGPAVAVSSTKYLPGMNYLVTLSRQVEADFW